MAGSVREAREGDAEQLRLGWEHQDEDPLLSTLDGLRAGGCGWKPTCGC